MTERKPGFYIYLGESLYLDVPDVKKEYLGLLQLKENFLVLILRMD